MLSCKEDKTNMFASMLKFDWLAIGCCHSIFICTFIMPGEYKIIDKQGLLTSSKFDNLYCDEPR